MKTQSLIRVTYPIGGAYRLLAYYMCRPKLQGNWGGKWMLGTAYRSE